MRRKFFGLVVAMAAGAADAQAARQVPPDLTVQCIEVDGRTIPALCQSPASRLDRREYICSCPKGGQRVDVPVCAPGQKPPAESRALNVARRAAGRDGSLVGDTFEGRPICAVRGPSG